MAGLPRGVRVYGMSEEFRLTCLLFLFSFFISGVPRVYTQTAAHALFIESYGANAMPYAYLAEALCVPLAGYLYLKAQSRFGLRALLVSTLACDILSLVCLRMGAVLAVPFASAAAIVWFEVEFVFSSLLLWGLANQLMTLRQSKRLFGFVSAGDPVAVIICGLSTPLLLDWLTTGDLFLLSALGAAVGIALALHITARHNPPADPDAKANQRPEDPATQGARDPWWRDGYIVTMTCAVFVSQLAYFFVDSAFYVEASRRFPDEAALAGFIGLISAAVGAVSLAVSLVVSGPLMKRFGVRGGLLTLPLLLLAGAGAVVLDGHLGEAGTVLFWLVAGNKIIDQSFRYSLDKTSSVMLYQPLPPDLRLRVQAGLESVVEPLSGGIAGILLYAMLNGLGFTAFHVTHLVALIAAFWVVMVMIQDRGYVAALRHALASRRIGEVELALEGPEALACLRRGLTSPHPGEVLYSIELLDDSEAGLSSAEMAALLVHPAWAVRIEAARLIEEGFTAISVGDLAARLAAEEDGRVRGALVAALTARSQQDVVETAAAYLDDADENVRLGAYVGLLRHGGIEGVMAVGTCLLETLHAAEPERRRFAALVMERVGSAQFYRPLLTLLADPDSGVRLAAIRAAGVVRVPQLWPALLANLSRSGLDQDCVAAMAAIGEPMLWALEDFYRQPGQSQRVRRAIIAVCGKIGTPDVARWLLAQIDPHDRRLRGDLLWGLWRCNAFCDAENHPVVRDLLHSEVEAAAWLLACHRDYAAAAGEAEDAVCRALADEIATSVDNVFFLLALLVDDAGLDEAWSHYRNGGPVRRAYVLEMLDNVLDGGLRDLLFPLLEAETLAEKAVALEPLFPQRELSARERLVDLALLPDWQGVGWARVCALHALATGPLPEVNEVMIATATASSDSLVREIGLWLRDCGRETNKERAMLLTIEKVLILRGVSIFADVREHDLAHIAASARQVRLAKGDVLFREGDLGTSLYVIVSGRLRMQAVGADAVELGEREVVGEIAVLSPEPRPATATALEDCLLLHITNQDLEVLIGDDVDVARGIIHVLCRRLRESTAPLA